MVGARGADDSALQALADLGWVQGRNLVIEQRSAENQNDRLPELVADLVRAGVSVIVAENASATRAAMQATSTIPIVMAGVGDPVRYGLIASLAQPGGNVTGLSFLISEMMLKNLELLKEVAPRTARVALLVNPSNPGVAPAMADLQRAAPALGISVIQVDVLTPEDFERAFATIVRERADGILVTRRQVLEPRVLDLNEVVNGVVPMLKRLIGEDVELIVHPQEPLDRVRGDRGQIEQVIMNLVVNATPCRREAKSPWRQRTWC